MHMPKFCPNCGSELPFPEAEICPRCGVRIKEQPKEQPKSDGTINKSVIIISYVAAIIIPLIGLIMAIYFLVKKNVVHFVGLLLVSLIMWGFWTGVLTALGM
jgi:uncharacterized membrane protein YvbJ